MFETKYTEDENKLKDVLEPDGICDVCPFEKKECVSMCQVCQKRNCDECYRTSIL